MILNKIKAGMYETDDGKIIVYKDRETGFWYAEDKKTGQSVVDCEKQFYQIKRSLGII